MRPASDLMDVVHDLCVVASALLLRGQASRSQILLDQSVELLFHRGQLLALETTSRATRHPRSPDLTRRRDRWPS